MSEYSKEDIENNKVMAVLMLIPVFFVIYYISGSDSPYVKHCADQGMILTICFIVVSLAGWLLTKIPLLGGIIGIIFKILTGILAVIMVIQMVRAAKGTI